MKFKKISTKMMAFILPIIILAMAVLTIISAISSRSIINEQISQHMSSELSAQNALIEDSIDKVKATADTLAKSISATYTTTKDLAAYEQLLTGIIGPDEIVLGSGIWFEPYVFDPEQKYVGPYVYKDGDETVITYDYSNAEYDYFNQEYYLLSKDTFDAVITDPYYDETSGIIMSSCSAPIYNPSGTYLGCVTVDLNLTSV